MTPLDGPIVLKLLLVMFLSLMSALVPSAPERDTRDSGYGLFVFATASHPTVTDGSSSGGNPIFFWRGLEPEEGEYDWDQLDKAVVQALTTGTRIIPRIVTNFSIFGETSPDWFFDAKGAQYYYPHDEAENLDYRAPIPWDPVYEDKFGAFLEALGERYNGNPAIEFFQITSAGVYGELYLGSNRPDGFTVQVYKASIEHWTDAWRDALRVAPENPTVLANLAEALVLVDDAQLTGEAAWLLDAALAADPGNPKALWYGGLAADARGDAALAAERWRALLAQGPPDALREVIERRLRETGVE